jgi:hypothetical protein
VRTAKEASERLLLGWSFLWGVLVWRDLVCGEVLEMIKNYTTEVDEQKTVAEIIGLLSSKGARAVQIDYDEKQRPVGVSFVLIVLDVPVPFKLPCDFDGVFKALASRFKDRYAKANWERNATSMPQARRVAWRIIKDWVGAQLAIIEAGQATLAQVFLPYVRYQEEGGVTMYDKFLAQVARQKALPVGKENIA